MTQINLLTQTTSLSQSDQFPIWKTDAGAARRIAFSDIMAKIESDLSTNFDSNDYVQRIGSFADLQALNTTLYEEGALFRVGPAVFELSSGSTTILTLPGFEPVGDWNWYHFGAVGGGNDDGAAMNAGMEAIRDVLLNGGSAKITGLGHVFHSSIPINMSLIRSPGGVGRWQIEDTNLYSTAAGKAAIETLGSRYGSFKFLMITGDENLMPCSAIAGGRATNAGFTFCSFDIIMGCRTEGYFSVDAISMQGAESTAWFGCTFLNAFRGGGAGFHCGYNNPGITWTYASPLAGPHSNIYNSFYHVYWGSSVTNRTSTITAFTNGVTSTVTFSSTTMTDLVGKTVLLHDVPDAENLVFTVLSQVGQTVTIDLDSSAMTTSGWIGGQIIVCDTVASLKLGRNNDTCFDGSCYVTNYGYYGVEFLKEDGSDVGVSNVYNFLFEGHGQLSHYLFNANSAVNMFFKGCKFYSQSTKATNGLMDKGSLTTYVAFENCEFDFPTKNGSHPNASDDLFVNPGNYEWRGGKIGHHGPDLTAMVSAMRSFQGDLFSYSDDLYISGITITDTSWVPAVTSSGGAYTSYTVDQAAYSINGNQVHCYAQITVVTNGAASGAMIIDNPTDAPVMIDPSINGSAWRVDSPNYGPLQARSNTVGNDMRILSATGGNWTVDGASVEVFWTYWWI